MPAKTPRGFALLLVMIIAIACVIIAVGLTSIQGKGKEAAIASEDGDRAKMLAESGMQRAVAYANEVKKASVDFDFVLDPDIVTTPANAADCTGIATTAFNLNATGSAPRAGATTFTPKFTEAAATIADFPADRKWMRVAENGGAYFIRFEDDNDDYQQNARWATQSNNNLVPNNCIEGSDTTQATNNPARDRNNAIWVISMGIYPGTDPNTARHRHVVRRFLSQAATQAAAGLYVGNNVTGGVSMENTFGNVDVDNDIGGSVTACGTVRAGNNNNSNAGGACGPNPFSKLANQAIGRPAIPPFRIDPKHASFYDWQSPCNFYSDTALGLFFWDPTANAGACGAYVGDLVPPSQPAVPTAVPNGCWVPILLNVGGRAEPFVPYSTGPLMIVDPDALGPLLGIGNEEFGTPPLPAPGLAAACTPWEPNSYPVVNGIADAGTGIKPASWYNALTTRSKPDWSLCGGPTYPESEVRWGANPPNPTPSALPTDIETCTGPNPADPLDDECNGRTQVFSWCATGGSQNPQFTLDTEARRKAMPTSVLYVKGNFDNGGSPVVCTPTDSTNPIGPFTWPMFTLVVENNYDQPNNQDTCWGIGTKKGNYASIVVGNDFRDGAGSSSINVAGSMWVRNNVSVDKALTIFGTVRVDNDLRENASGVLRWRYTRDIGNVSSAVQAAPPSLRVEFASGL